MILYYEKLIISPITTHISLKSVSNIISNKNFLYNKIKSIYKTIQKDFKINQPNLLISGLNPHCGENGKVGIEEIKYINPIIKKLNINKYKVTGPVSADSMLNTHNLKKFDCFIYFYHDQALIPFKYISKFSGINYTGNLSIIRVSPDHGTAYDLVGKNQASDKSLIKCFKLINTIKKNRYKYENSKKISKSKLY